MGIQIVYGNVAKAVKEAEASNRPLLIYSWLPRAEIMTPNRFVRITLESFYHCGKGDAEGDASSLSEPSFLAKPLLRGVTACDFPVEQVEKAVVWRLQQPSATNAKLFVGKFSLNATQLEQLLKLGDELSSSQNSSRTELDEIACRWLNNNTDEWEVWLPSSQLYDTTLFQWKSWVVGCGLCFFVIGCATIWKAMKMKKEPEKGGTEGAEENYWRLINQKGNMPTCTKKATRILMQCISSFATTLFCWRLFKKGPLKEYLSDAGWCLVNFGFSKPNSGWKLVLFVLGKLFVAASTGFFKILIFETWLGDGLNKLSLEVTISCAVLMLTLQLIEWFIDWSTTNELLRSGEQIVRCQLESKLVEVSNKMSAEELAKMPEEAKAIAKELASGCYMSAVNAFFSLLGVVFATGFLFYYMFKDVAKEGMPQDPSFLLIFAFSFGPIWLILGLGGLRYRSTSKCQDRVSTRLPPSNEEPPANDETANSGTAAPGTAADVISYKQALLGIQWYSVYLLWALAPIFMTPLMNDFDPAGTNSALQSDVLTVNTHAMQNLVSICG